MKASIPRLFADVTAMLEDMHGISVEGHCCDNSPDMQRVLFFHLRSRLAALDGTLQKAANALNGEPS